MWFDWGCSNLCLQRWAWSQDWPLRTLAFPWPQRLVQRWACDWNEANEISFYDFWWSPWKRGCLFLPELLSCWNESLDMLWSSLLPLGKSRAENRASKKATVWVFLLENFMERGAWWAAACEVIKSRKQLRTHRVTLSNLQDAKTLDGWIPIHTHSVKNLEFGADSVLKFWLPLNSYTISGKCHKFS